MISCGSNSKKKELENEKWTDAGTQGGIGQLINRTSVLKTRHLKKNKNKTPRRISSHLLAPVHVRCTFKTTVLLSLSFFHLSFSPSFFFMLAGWPFQQASMSFSCLPMEPFATSPSFRTRNEAKLETLASRKPPRNAQGRKGMTSRLSATELSE